MASRTSTSSGRDTSSRTIKARSMPFVGLLLLPPAGLVAGLVIHYAIHDSVIAVGLTALGFGVISSVVALLAYGLGRKRDPVVCWHVVLTVMLTGLAEAVTVVVGLQRWWTTTFVIGGELLAASWMLHRIDALRRDSKQAEEHEDPLTKKLGLENTRFGRPRHHRDEQGEVTRIEVPVRHGPGETVEVVQQAVPGIESLARAPRGRSRAVPGEHAGQSQLVIITKDVLKGLVEYPGPSSPGGCITEPLVAAVAEDQQPAPVYVAGGPVAINPASRGRMGMTRTGKTMNAQVEALEAVSRRNVAMMWFDSVKGAQTVRPLRRGLDVIVASDDAKAFRAGMRALKNLIMWRANRLGECGYAAWKPECATDPRLMMPYLIVHFEEADVLCDEAPDEMVFLASKGLSVGVGSSFSLQRADATSMPTGLRFNIGNWSCFGTGDEYSAGFALSDATIAAGAHPENWKQSRPGYHYTEGIGIPEERWPVVLKSMFATDAAMEAHCEVWGPRMMPLDAGSAQSLGEWYPQAKAATEALVAGWDRGPKAGPVVHDGASTSTNTLPTPGPDAEGEAAVGEAMAVIREEIAEMVADGTIPAQLDAEAEAIDPSRPVPPPPPDDLNWADKEAAPTREVALAAFERALREVAADEGLRDPDDDSVVLFQVGTLVDRYKFRSRPWFSETLTALVEGDLSFPGLVVDRTDRSGQYRLQCLAEVVAIGNTA